MPGRPIRCRGGLVLAAAAAALAAGCASLPYDRVDGIECEKTLRLKPDEPQFVRGRPIAVLDAADWIWPGSLLGKLLLWDVRIDSHEISPETEERLRRYLAFNGLDNVKVRVNAYSVCDEWRRTIRNRAVGAGWRYTFGILAWVGYTILPGRLFGGDNYNPYSNTVSLYSDIPAVALHEGAHAKDLARTDLKGTYSFLYLLPLVPLHHERLATRDALSYLRAEEPAELQRQGYHLLYPAYGTYVGGEIGAFTGAALPVTIAAVIAGHVAGRVRASQLPETCDGPAAPPADAPDAAPAPRSAETEPAEATAETAPTGGDPPAPESAP